MPNLSDIKLIEKNQNIETYSAKLRVKFQKVITKNINKALFYKNTSLENKKNRKIYDIIQDNNILYIYFSEKENINDILFRQVKIIKENIMEGQCKPINKKEIYELFKKEESMCKIKLNKIVNNELRYFLGTGFFLKFNIKGIPFNKMFNNK